MAPPGRKTGSVSRGTGDVENDPERANATHARSKNPLEDPEVRTETVAKGPPPRPRKPPRRSSTGATEAGEPGGEEPTDYRTGQSYRYDDDSGEGVAGSELSLEGDGLEPMEPELAPRTKAMPALDRDDEEDEDVEEDDENATQAGPPIKLEIVKGPDAGKKRRFKGVRMIIGRTPGVDLLLSDQSVSRRHVEIVRSDGGVLVRDLGSGNGTRVNGDKVAEKVLEHGDEISIGKTTIRYIDELSAFRKARDEAEAKEAQGPAAAAVAEGEAPDGEGEVEGAEAEAEGGGEEGAPATSATRRATRTRPRTTRHAEAADDSLVGRFKALNPIVRYGILGSAAFFLLLIVVFAATRPPPPPPIDLAKVSADAKMQEARNAVRDARFEDAVRLIEEAEGVYPGIDTTKLGNGARLELAAQRGLEEVKNLVGQGRFEDARSLLQKVPTSVKGDDERKKVEAALAQAEIEYKKQQIDEFLAAGELEAAKQLLAELPVIEQAAVAPSIVEFEHQLADQSAADAQAARQNANAAASANKARREEAIAVAFAVVERKFAGAEWARAAAECDRVIDNARGDGDVIDRAKMLKRSIPNFGRNFDEGTKKFKQKQLTAAARPLRSAHQLFKQMKLTANPYGRELEDMLAQASVVAGKEAAMRSDLASAAQYFREAAKLDPSDTQAKDGLDKVINKAEDLYQEAYMIRDRDPREALRLFKIVALVTPVGSTTHEKAKNQIAAMQP